MAKSPSARDEAAYPQHHELVSFWTPDGWLRGPAPMSLGEAQHRKAQGETIEPGIYELELAIQACPDTDQHGPRVDVWSSGIGLRVEIWGYDIRLADFYVSREHEAAFMVERLPALIQAFGGIRRGENAP